MLTVFVWDNDSNNGLWNDPNNWDLNSGVPDDAADVATFGNAGSGPVSLGGGPITVGEVLFDNTASTFDIQNGTLNVDLVTQTAAATATNTISAEIDTAGLAVTVSGGRLDLTNQNNDASGSVTIGSGATLGAVTDETGGALGTLDVNVTDGNLDLLPGAQTISDGVLIERWFDGTFGDPNIDPIDSGAGFLTQTPGFERVLTTAINYPDEGTMNAASNGLVGADGIGGLWIGSINIGGSSPVPAGDVSFNTNSDDGTTFWVDLDDDGLFEHAGDAGDEMIVDNKGGHGDQDRFGTANLAAGSYAIAIGFYEGSGGETMLARFAVGNTTTVGNFSTINPGAAAQAGLWSAVSVPPAVIAGTLQVTGNSQVSIEDTIPSASFANLITASNATLAIDSVGMGQPVSFNNVEMQGGTATFDGINMPSVTLSNITETAPTDLTLNGAAAYALDTFNAYSGETTINADAAVTISALGALGTIDGGTTVNTGGALAVANGLTYGIAELLTLHGFGNAKLEGAFSKASGANVFWNAPIVVASDAEIRATGGNELFFDAGGITLNPGVTLTLDADNRLNFRTAGTITGDATTSLAIGGGDRVDMELGIPNFDGTIVVGSGTGTENQGRYDVHVNDGFGSSVGNTTVVGNDATVVIRNGRTHVEDFVIEGNGRGTEGALRQENNTNVIDGTITLTGDAQIDAQSGSLTVTGAVTGGFAITKTSGGLLNLRQASVISDFALDGGSVRIGNVGGLGATTGLGIDAGEALEFDPGTGNTFTYDGSSTLQLLAVNNGTITAVSGTTILDTTVIRLPLVADINFGGAGNLIVNQPFGNGSAAAVPEALSHFGYHVSNNGQLFLQGNGGLMVGGSTVDPATHANFEGHGLLQSGPGNRGLDFNNDGDFRGVPASIEDDASGDGFVIDQNDNFSNLFFGTLTVTAANAGTWTFDGQSNDDVNGFWIDLDRDGIFESTRTGLGDQQNAIDEQISWDDDNSRTVDLVAGEYMLAFTHREGGGGSTTEFEFISPASHTSLTDIRPTDFSQAGLWRPLDTVVTDGDGGTPTFNYVQVTPDNNVNVAGTGTFTFNGDNSFNGSVTLAGATLVAGHNNALGLDGGDVLATPGGSLGFQNGVTVDGEDVFGFDGALINISGNNTFLGNITGSDVNLASLEISVIAQAGNLTVGQVGVHTLDLQYSSLTIDSSAGAGVTINSDIESNAGADTEAAALGHYGYHIINDALALNLNQNGGMLNGRFPAAFNNFEGAGLLTDGPSGRGLDFNNDGEFRAVLASILDDASGDGRVIDQNDNFSNLFVGYLNVSPAEAGTWQFHIAQDDDIGGIWLDLDRDGTFETDTGTLATNNGELLSYEDGGPKSVSLAAGRYLFAVIQREGGGGSGIDVEVQSPSMGALDTIKPTDAAQAGFWTFGLVRNNEVTKTGAGTATLSGTNSYDAQTFVDQGTLVVTNNAALSTSTDLSDGTILADGATLSLQGVTSVTETIAVNSAVLNSPGGLGATRVDISNNGPLQFTVSNANGVTGTIDAIFDFAGTGLPGINNEFVLDRDGNPVQVQPVSAAVGDTIAFSGVAIPDGNYTLQANFNGTPIIWQGDVSSDWNTGANWVGDVVPGPMDLAAFNDADSVSNTVNLSSAGPVGGIILENDSDTFTFIGGTLTTNALEQTGDGTNVFDTTASIASSAFLGNISAGLLRLANLNVSSTLTGGQWHISAGTLDVDAAGAATSLGATAVEIFLEGGTLDVNGVPNTTANALAHFGYHINNDGLALNLNNNGGVMGGGIPTSFQNFEGQGLLTSGPGGRGLDFNNDGDFRAVPASILDDASGDGFVIDQNDNYTNLFLGTLTVAGADIGDWAFDFTADDDTVGFWIDLNRNGIFESDGSLGSNNGEQITFNDGTERTVNLLAGEYLVAFTHREGGGGSQIEMQFTSPTLSKRTLLPTEGAQAGLWSYTEVSSGALGNNVTVTADSTINVSAPEIAFGNLTITDPGIRLTNTTDAAGSLASFTDVSLAGDSTFETQNNASVELSNVVENSLANLEFQGDGTYFLPTANSFSGSVTLADNVTVEVAGQSSLGLADGSAATGTFVTDNGSLRFAGVDFTSERLTIAGSGNSNSPGALHHTGNNDSFLRTEVILSAAATISSSGDYLRILGGIDNAGFEIELNARDRLDIEVQGIRGSGDVRTTGGDEIYFNNNAANTYSGDTIVEDNTRLRIRRDDSLGDSTGVTIIRGGGTVLLEDGNDTHTENFFIEGNGRGGNEGALWNLNATNTIVGTVTLTGDALIRSDAGELLIDGQVTGAFTLIKSGPAMLTLIDPANDFADFDHTGGTLRLHDPEALGQATQVTLESGETLDYFGNLTVNAANTLQSIVADGGRLSASGGTTHFDRPITLPGDTDVRFGGDGLLHIDEAFGNGAGNVNSVFRDETGTVFLNAANTFSGDVMILGGAVVANNPGSLGETSGQVIVQPGGSLALAGGITVSEPTTLDGTGAPGYSGALTNLADSNIHDGPVTVALSSMGIVGIGSEAGDLTVESDLNLQFSGLQLGGDGELVLNGDITEQATANLVEQVAGYVFNGNTLRLPGDPNQIQAIMTDQSLDLNGDADFRAMFSDLNQDDNYGTTFIFDIVIPDRLGGGTPYNVTFSGVRSDDANEFWIDLDQDGTLSTTGTNGDERIINEGCCPTNFATTLNLAPGTYGFMLRHREGGGGSDLRPQIDIGDGNGMQFFDPGDMLGGIQLGTQFQPNNSVLKVGDGVATLTGNNLGLISPITINGGMLVADGSVNGTASIGAPGGGITIDQGGALGLADFGDLSAAIDQVTLGNGSLVSVTGDNSVSTTLTVEERSLGTVGISSLEAGSTFTIDSDIELLFSQLQVEGAGDTVINGVVSGNNVAEPRIFPLFAGLPGGDDQLYHFGYHINSDGLAMDLNGNGGMFNAGDPTTFNSFEGAGLLTSGPGNRGLDFNSDGDFRAAAASLLDDGSGDGQVIDQNDNYSNLFLGFVHVDAASAGAWDFRVIQRDDPVGMWIDLDQDGVFESSAAGLGSDRGEQLAWNDDTGTKTVLLAEGYYLVAFTHREGGGGSGINIGFRSPLMGSEDTIEPANPSQAGLWSTQQTFIFEANNQLVKLGSGTLTLNAANTFDDGAIVSAGTLLANNGTSATGPGDVTVDGPTAVLGGTGTVAGSVTVLNDGTVNPGTGPTAASLTTGSAVFNVDSFFDVLVEAGSADTLTAAGTVDLGGATLLLTLADDVVPGDGDVYTIIDTTAGVTGTFAGLNEGDTIEVGNLVGGQPRLRLFQVSYVASGGNDVTLTAVNRVPVAVADDPATNAGLVVNEDGTLTIAAPGVLANDTDADGDPLTATVVTGTSNGALTLNPDGSFTYTPTAHFSGTDSFTYTVSDGQASSATSATVTIDIAPLADTPNLTAVPATGDEDTAIDLTITASVVDTDGSETFDVTISGIPAGATVEYNDGAPQTVTTPSFTITNATQAILDTLTITPLLHSDATITLNVSATTNDSATLTTGAATNSASASTTLAVTVTAIADAPTVTVSPASGTENVPIGLSIAAALVDADGSETITSITITGVPADATLSAFTTDNGGGSFTLTPAQLAGLTITKVDGLNPAVPFDLSITATTTETAGGDTATSASVTLTVTVDNTPPAAGITGPTDTVPGRLVTFTFTANDANPGDTPFTYMVDWGDGSSDTVTGTATITLDHSFQDFSVDDPLIVTLTVTDKDGEASVATHEIFVVPVAMDGSDILAGGTGDGDRIIFYSSNVGIRVSYNGITFPRDGSAFSLGAGGKLLAFGQGGNDQILAAGGLLAQAVFDGGIGNDYLAGGILADTLIGGGGNDVVLGGQGDNLLIGDDREGVAIPGADRLEGRDGLDTIFGGAGNDRLNGGAGSDTLDGGDGNDFVFGGLDDDLLLGGSGIDTLNGYYGNDIVLGGDDADQIFGGSDQDLLIGGAGADRLRGDAGEDTLIGGGSALDASIEAALDALLASNTAFSPALQATLDAWYTSFDRAGFGADSDDGELDDLTGGSGGDAFQATGNRLRDFRSDDTTF